jgi:hypothetical protein
MATIDRRQGGRIENGHMSMACLDALENIIVVPIFTANHAGGKWLSDVRQLEQNGAR